MIHFVKLVNLVKFLIRPYVCLFGCENSFITISLYKYI